MEDDALLEPRSLGPRVSFDIAQHDLGKQLEMIDAVDTKLATIIGFASAVLVVFGGALAIRRDGVPLASVGLLAAAAAAYAALMVVVCLGYRMRSWFVGPALLDADVTKADNEEEDLAWAADRYNGGYYRNFPQWEGKARLASLALLLMFVQVILLAASLIVLLLAAPSTSASASPVLV
jgi:hypothetical protein